MNDIISKCEKWKLYGNPESNYLLAGHSHLFAMYMAMNNNAYFQQFFGLITQSEFNKPNQPDSDYWDFVAHLSKNKNTLISWNGNQHNIHFLLNTNLKFSAIGFHENKALPSVPLGRIKDLFRPTFYELELILSRFPNLENVCLLGTPSPKPKKLLNQFIQKDQYFIDLAKKLNLDQSSISVSDDDLRIFMWKITQDLTAETAIKFGCKFLATPKSTHDGNYLMLEKYSAPDLTHANESFGDVMLSEIQSFYGISRV